MFDILLMTAPQGGSGGGSGMPFLVMMVLILMVMYFFMIRPQQKREKARQGMLADLKKGDKVVTSSGMLGTVWGLKDNIVVLKIDDEVKVEILKSAIASKME